MPTSEEPSDQTELGGPGTAGEKSPRMKWSRSDLLTALPGLAALLLGGLYALGALLTMADLRGQAINVHDALPLIPIEELLSRGIGTAVYAGVALGALVMFDQLMHRYQQLEDNSSAQRVVWVAAFGMMLLALGLAFFALPVVPALSIIVAFLVLVLAEFFLPVTMRQSVALAFAPIVIGLVLHFLVAPTPLARATVKPEDSEGVSGVLVTQSDGMWYLETKDGEITAVPNDRLDSAEITTAARPELHEDLVTTFSIPWWVAASALALICGWAMQSRWGPELLAPAGRAVRGMLHRKS
jgi:hypothetical protein